jgi:hypothetical protein
MIMSMINRLRIGIGMIYCMDKDHTYITYRIIPGYKHKLLQPVVEVLLLQVPVLIKTVLSMETQVLPHRNRYSSLGMEVLFMEFVTVILVVILLVDVVPFPPQQRDVEGGEPEHEA